MKRKAKRYMNVRNSVLKVNHDKQWRIYCECKSYKRAAEMAYKLNKD
jgi:hypothetical protein